MSEYEPIDMQRIVSNVLHKMAEGAVARVIESHAGYGISDAIQAIVKEEARKVAQSPEMQDKMRKQMLYWIGKDYKEKDL